MPSPVVARSRKMTWPDCSPPERPAALLQRLQHVAVADVGLHHGDPGPAHGLAEARGWPSPSPPRCRRAGGPTPGGRGRRRAMSWSPSTRLPRGVDGQHPVGVAVEGQPGVGAPGHDLGLEGLGVGRPAPSLMLRPSGRSWRTWTVAPSRRKTSGATSDAAPLAQSSTRVRPANAPGAEHAHHARRRSGRGRRRRSTVPTPSPIGAGGCVPAGVRPSRRSSSASSRASTSSLSLRPPAAKNLIPLSWKGLWDAEITAAGWPSAADSQATPGVGSTPRSATSAPSAISPADRAAWRRAPETRVSRPIRNRSPPEHAGRGPAQGQDDLGGEIGVGDAADAVGTEPQGQERTCPVSAWSTGEPSGPSSGRTSCFPSPGRRG